MIVIEQSLLCVGAGGAIAAILSWKRNKDFLCAVLAFLFGWAYVIYWVFTE
jgi:hypothetical protein